MAQLASGRPGLRYDRGLRGIRRHLRLSGRHHGYDGHHRHAGNADARVCRHAFHRLRGCRRNVGNPDSAQHTIYYLWDLRGNLHRRTLCVRILPGIIMAILFIATISVMVKLKPKLAPNSESFTWRQRLESLRGIMGVVILFLFVFGGMFGGVFTVNEAAAAGAFLAMVFMAINRKLRWNSLMAVLRETVKSTSMVYLILLGATVLGNFLASSQLPSRLATYVGGMNVSATALMLIIVAIYFCLGCLMDGMAMILLTVPIFLPIIENFGINKIWFGVLVILMGQIGGITPPVGMSVYVIGGVVKDVPLQTIFRESLLLSSACCLRLS